MKCDLECSNLFLLVSKSLTAILGLGSTLVILKLCSNHLKHFNNPLFQQKIIGTFNHKNGWVTSIVIIMIVPVYSINAILGTFFVEKTSFEEIMAIIRAMYEAVLIVSFFHLIVAYVCYDDEVCSSIIELC